MDQILRLRDEMHEVARHEFAGRRIEGGLWQRMQDIFTECLPAFVWPEALRDSLRYIAGTIPTEEDLKTLCHRLAGNLPALQRRYAVPPWSVQRVLEWCPMQVVACRKEVSVWNRFGAMLTFKIMAGSACPMRIQQFWTLRFCRWLSRDLGFSRPAGLNAKRPCPFPYETPEQFVSLRLGGLLDPKLSGAEPVFDLLRFPTSARKYNADILNHRFRTGPEYPCPLQMAPMFPCQACPAGYENCRGATHRLDYVIRDCPECRKPAYFDPERADRVCVNCYNAAAYHRPEPVRHGDHADEPAGTNEPQ